MNEQELCIASVLLIVIVYFIFRFKNQSKDMRNLRSAIQSKLSLNSVPINNIESERKLRGYNQLMTCLHDDCTTVLESVFRGQRITNNGQCAGSICRETRTVQWFTYSDLLTRIKHFGDGLISLKQQPAKSVIGMFCRNRIEYMIAEFGCYWHSLIIATIYDTLGPNVCTFVANQAEIELIVCDTLDRVQAILSKATSFKYLKYVVVIDKIPYSYISKAKNFGIEVYTMEQLEQFGKDNPITERYPKPDDTAVICYTSGTTGIPKGVILTHKNIIASSSGLVNQLGKHKLRPTDTFLSYLPLAHIMEQVSEVSMFMSGSKVVYFSGDILRLLEDIQICRPTILLTVPRLLNKIYAGIYNKVRGNLMKEWLFRTALASKIRAYREGRINNNTIWDKLIFDKVRNNLGGSIRLIATGSAMLDPHVGEVLRSILGCQMVNGYGQTETCSCLMTLLNDKYDNLDNVGPPLASAYIKLEDIPEMNYYASEGKGEILVKGPLVSKGYYKDPVDTAKLFDEDGWLLTGDVGMWTENGNIKLIDRKKNFFKLSQGEFIAVEKLETAYIKSDFVSQLYVYGDSSRSYLVAIIVPEKDYLESWRLKNGIRGNFHDQCKDKRVKDALIDDFRKIAVEENFNKLEYIKKVYIHTEPFSVESGLLTPTMKQKRFELQKYFSKIIDDLYKRDD
ncbi:hypothetical protein BLOT_015404 [Blomia tropicalis]|nr:hypothetical protein BLOT_015404 [Blomia tropicalis]